ncbi:hypothetical protein EYF80_029276 [Liparis tanakae]|uniref:Uncharacterized protein n=1 Tax=Liparis tanakae TaxID=230148 RepID=A0A4Z2H6C9_9TELE|nr:hypothetical protein EYF80_029276 [Liparis tanakae]
MSLPTTRGQTSRSVTSEARHSLKPLVNMALKYGLQDASTTRCTWRTTQGVHGVATIQHLPAFTRVLDFQPHLEVHRAVLVSDVQHQVTQHLLAPELLHDLQGSGGVRLHRVVQDTFSSRVSLDDDSNSSWEPNRRADGEPRIPPSSEDPSSDMTGRRASRNEWQRVGELHADEEEEEEPAGETKKDIRNADFPGVLGANRGRRKGNSMAAAGELRGWRRHKQASPPRGRRTPVCALGR